MAPPLTCSECGTAAARVQRITEHGREREICPSCFENLLLGCRQLKGAGRGDIGGLATKAAKKTGWGTAKQTKVDGIQFPSLTEARVYLRLRDEVAELEGARLYRQVRFPLLNLSAGKNLLPRNITVDFVIRHADGSRRVIDAKPKRWKSRDWVRGKAALEAELGIEVEEAQR